MGDGVCALPALKSIRDHFPQAEIHWLLDAKHLELPHLADFASKNLYDKTYDKRSLKGQELKDALIADEFDLVIHLPQPKARLLTLLKDMWDFRFQAKIRSGCGWKVDAIFFSRKKQEAHRKFQNERDRLMDILSKNGIHVPSSLDFPLDMKSVDLSKVDEMLLPVSGGPIISIVPGAKRPQNRWPAEYFQKLIDELKNDHGIVILGSEGDKEILPKYEDSTRILNLCGKTSVLETAEILRRSHHCISNDTGPMHLAYAVQTPVTAIFSARDFPGIWFPPASGEHSVLRNYDVACSACLSNTCANNICMKQIGVEQVLSAMNTSTPEFETT